MIERPTPRSRALDREHPALVALDDPDESWFEGLPLALSSEDFSRPAAFLEELRAAGVTDLDAHFRARPEDLDRAISCVEVKAVNKALRDLRETDDPSLLLGLIDPDRIDDELRASMFDQLLAVWTGVTNLQHVAHETRASGRNLDLIVYWSMQRTGGCADPARVLVAFSDISEQLEANEKFERSLHRRRMLLHIGMQLASTLEREPALEIIVDSCEALLGSQISALMMLDHDTQTIASKHIIGASEALLQQFDYEHLRTGFASLALESGGLIVSRPGDDLRSSEALRNVAAQGARAGASFESMALVPITGIDSMTGLLVAINVSGQPELKEDDLQDLRLLAGQASIALQRTSAHQSTVQARDDLQSVVNELRSTQADLVEARHMEAVGVLAAGVAHDINTPVQYISDNVEFLGASLAGLLGIITDIQELLGANRSGSGLEGVVHTGSLAEHLDLLLAQSDLEFLRTDVPLAVSQTIEGIDRVGEIVNALKEYSHLGGSELTTLDLHQMIDTAVNVSRSEWSKFADIALDLEHAPDTIFGHHADLVRVLTNLIVNAAQAIAADTGGRRRGEILISAHRGSDFTTLRLADDGPGIPAAIQAKVFDRFFTTKEVGKGSGQGLALARTTIVERHQGRIAFQSEPGGGTTFTIELPNQPGI